MAQTVCILLGDEDRMRLAAIVVDRNRPQKHVQRARIVLLSADRLPVLAVARQTDASRPAVWRWQQRFAGRGIGGPLGGKTRTPGKKPLPAATVAKIRDCQEFRAEVGHDGSKGAQPCRDAKNRLFQTPLSTNFWKGPTWRESSTLMACLTD